MRRCVGAVLAGVAAITGPAQHTREVARFDYRSAKITVAAFSSDGKSLVTASEPGEVFVRDGVTGEVRVRCAERRFEHRLFPQVREISVSTRLFVMKSRGSSWVFNVDTGLNVANATRQLAKTLKRPAPWRAAFANEVCGVLNVDRILAMPSEGDRAVVVMRGGDRCLLSRQGGEWSSRVLSEHRRPVREVDLSADGTWLYVQVGRGTRELVPVGEPADRSVWSLGDDDAVPRLRRSRAFAVGAGAQFVIVHAAGWLRVDAATQRVVDSHALPMVDGESLRAIGVNGDGTRMLCGGPKWSAWVVAVPNGTPVRLPSPDEPADIRSFAFSQDGERLWVGVEEYGGGPGGGWPRIDAYALLPEPRLIRSERVVTGASSLVATPDALLSGGVFGCARRRLVDLSAMVRVLSRSRIAPRFEDDATVVVLPDDAGASCGLFELREDRALAVSFSGWRLHSLPSLELVEGAEAFETQGGTVSSRTGRFAVAALGEVVVRELVRGH